MPQPSAPAFVGQSDLPEVRRARGLQQPLQQAPGVLIARHLQRTGCSRGQGLQRHSTRQLLKQLYAAHNSTKDDVSIIGKSMSVVLRSAVIDGTQRLGCILVRAIGVNGLECGFTSARRSKRRSISAAPRSAPSAAAAATPASSCMAAIGGWQ